ncbi:MAG: tetratricopeptide repeat protein [Pseudomonadota bacterium]
MNLLLNSGEPPRDWIKDTTTEGFMADVIEASRKVPVLVDFWAAWCGPCKTLGPALEKAVNAAGGRVRLVKVDVDQNQMLASQLGVQSIPMVFAFWGGRPVDYFTGALPEAQIKAFIDRVCKATGAAAPQADGLEDVLRLAEEARTAKDMARAGQLYSQVLEADRGNVKAIAGLARCYLAAGDVKRGREVLALTPPDKRTDADILGAEAALALAAQAAPKEDIASLKARLERAPSDHQARFDLAAALLAAGDTQGAIEALLAIIARERDWNDGAARLKLLKIFDALGAEDPVTLAGRRRLSSILFA